MTAPISNSRALYTLAILSLISALNYYDRNLISILVEDLKRDLLLSDSQIGLLSGLAFAFVYCIASLPIARYADGGRRVRTLGFAAAFWSIMTGLCGMATSFTTMLAARFGVGIGEAGGAPTTHAIVAESFGPKWRGTALAVIGLSGAVGITAALSGGGYIAQHHGWRMAFYAAAVPGIAMTLVLLLTVREPRVAAGSDRPAAVPLGKAIRALFGRPAYLWCCIAISIGGIGAFGNQAFAAAYLMRHFHLNSAEVGASYGSVVGASTIIGILFGGILGDWLSRKHARWPFYFVAFAFGSAAPLSIVYLQLDDYDPVLMLLFPATLLATMWTAPIYAIVQALSGPRLRATGAALFMLCVNLVGQGFGPLLTGWLSDLLAQSHGQDGLRLALIAGTATYIVAMLCFLVAARTAEADIEAANRFGVDEVQAFR